MQAKDTYRLVVRRGPQPNQSFDLNKDVVTLGRDITNDFVINDREVSRHHMRYTRSGDGGYSVEDLGSTNGTFINGKRLSGIQPLKNGDIIGLGETVTLVYELARGPVSAGAPSSSPQAEDSPPMGQQPASSPPQQQQQQQPSAQPQPQPMGQQAGQQSYQPPPQQAYYPPPGYEGYDPYEMREEGGSSALKWFMFGCLGLLLMCCCITVVALVIIDTNDMWCGIPILNDILQAVQLKAC